MAPYFGLTGGWLTFWVGGGLSERYIEIAEHGLTGIRRLFDGHDPVWLRSRCLW